MAAPPSVTTLDFSGKYIMNKSQGDSTDKILELQGVGWFTRKAIALATITIVLKHYKDDQGVEHIDADQTLTGGIKGTNEARILDWQERGHEDHVFGAVLSRSERLKVDQVENEFLKKNWLPDTHEHGLIHTVAESDTPKSGRTWIAEQTWGFEDIAGERKYVRHVKFTGPKDELIEARLVYDYVGAS